MRESVHSATVAAVSTPPGKGGVALIRVSGADAFSVSDKVFLPRSGKALSACAPRSGVFGDILYRGKRIDDGIAIRFPAPHSFTGEDTVEITCHGGTLITATVLEAVLAAGAVPAPAGEYTRRAFLNGRMTLSDAEAIGTLLEAKSEAQILLSASRGRDLLSAQIRELRETLVSLMSSLFARIDYPDEDLGEFGDEESAKILLGVRAKLEKLLSSYRTGRAVTEGIPTVLCGKPNVGKSSLYNLLVGKDAAIVTDIPGTTRDVLESTVSLGRVLLRLSDTAGVHETSDTVEKIGVERSMERIREAALIIALFDGSAPLDGEDLELCDALKECAGLKIALLNKQDLGDAHVTLPDVFDRTLTFSVKGGDTEALSRLINAAFTDEEISLGEDAVVFSARQNASLVRAKEYVDGALEAFACSFGADAAASDVERAIGALGEVDGVSVNDEIVNDIFSKFCVGK